MPIVYTIFLAWRSSSGSVCQISQIIWASSGNVFADLGHPNPKEHQTKARLVSQIADIIEERQMTQADAAEIFGIDQPKVSALLNGRFRGFSVYRIMAFIASLGRDVEIVTKKHARHQDGKW